jgi:hypothetical protein
MLKGMQESMLLRDADGGPLMKMHDFMFSSSQLLSVG